MSYSKLNLTKPIIQAPMAGGATTPELIVSVCEQGALGSLGAGMTAPSELDKQISQLKTMTNKPFAVNLMVLSETESSDFSAQMPPWLAKYYHKQNIKVSLPQHPAQSFQQQLQVLLDNPVAVASFTFGIISREQVQALHKVGSLIVGTANHPLEAKAWADIGADMVCLQGVEAGGHRGGWLPQSENDPLGLLTLISQTKAITDIPLIGAGGIVSREGVQAVISAGASMAQIGTAFLITKESGIAPIYKQQLLKNKNQPRPTRLTRLFSGKLARGLVNEYMEKFSDYDNPQSLPPYPQLNAMTKPMRATAKQQDNVEYMSLWAGQGVNLVEDESVAELLNRLW